MFNTNAIIIIINYTIGNFKPEKQESVSIL